MRDTRRCGRGLIVAVVSMVLLAAPSTMGKAFAQEKEAKPDSDATTAGAFVEMNGRQVAVSAERLRSGRVWIDSRRTDCQEAREIGLGDHRGDYTPRERLRALRTLDRCVDDSRLDNSRVQSKQADDADLALAQHKADIAEQQKADGAIQEFLGMRFGVGVGVSYSQDDIISDAEVGAGNIVASTKDERTQPRVVLESHYYGWCHSRACNLGRFGVGPFLAIVAKDEKLISAFGTGVMLGWKDPKDGENDGWSIGIGAVLDANVKSLADGFEDGEPLPAGETEIRFEEKSRWSALLFFTRTF